MNVIACIDDKYGMLFNGRRQSRDRCLCNKILELTEGCRLWVSPYTAQLFSDTLKLGIIEYLSADIGEEDYCFAEDLDIDILLPWIQRVILFHWNRVYPADRFFPVENLKEHFSCVEREEFTGSSHDTITMEVYIRV